MKAEILVICLLAIGMKFAAKHNNGIIVGRVDTAFKGKNKQ